VETESRSSVTATYYPLTCLVAISGLGDRSVARKKGISQGGQRYIKDVMCYMQAARCEGDPSNPPRKREGPPAGGGRPGKVPVGPGAG